MYTEEMTMKGRMTSFGLPAALLAASLFAACQNTARGVAEDAQQDAAKAKDASQDAKDAAERAAHDAKDAAEHAADATRDAAKEAIDRTKSASNEVEQRSKDAATGTAGSLDAAAQTMQIKAAFTADKDVDASGINVDTDGSTKTVTLKGHVPTAAQKAAAERIAKEKAPDYRVVNRLVVQK
jgi:predicted small secreted protein